MFTVKSAKEQLLSQGESSALASPDQSFSDLEVMDQHYFTFSTRALNMPPPLPNERENTEFTPTWTVELPHTTTSNFLQIPMKIEAETETPTLAPYLKFEKHEVEHFGSLPTEVEELMQSA
ncbi:12439_t:CDS:1, partial [Cetraspora pellucida]